MRRDNHGLNKLCMLIPFKATAYTPVQLKQEQLEVKLITQYQSI